MTGRGKERARLRTFFEFDDIIDRPFWVLPLGLLQSAVIMAGIAWVSLNERDGRPPIIGFGILEGLLAGCALLIATAIIVYSIQQLHKLFARGLRSVRLKRLETEARDILRADYKRALKGLLHASGLQPEELKTVSNPPECRFEDLLFSQAELDRFLGPLQNQCYRAVTPHGATPQFAPTSADRLTGKDYFNSYCAPFRVIAIFFTDTAFVVGQAICDPFTGDIQKRVRTLPRDQIRTSEFQSQIQTVPVTKGLLEDWFENRRLDPAERKRTRSILARHDMTRLDAKRFGTSLPSLPFAFYQDATQLEIRLISGETINLPLELKQSLVQTPPRASIFDDDLPLSQSRFGAFSELGMSEGFDDDPIFNPRRADPDRPKGTPALWSSGRQSRYREYSAFWPFVRSVLFALICGTALLLLMNALTTDWSESFGSTSETDIRIETPDGIKPRTVPEMRLSPNLMSHLSTPSQIQFACTTRPVSVRKAASARAGELADLSANTPVLALLGADASSRTDWVNVIFEQEGAEHTGYIQTTRLEVLQPGVRQTCG